MNLLQAGQIFTNQLIQAICWTLIHSVWQGMLLALLAGLVLVFTRRSVPLLRYRLLTGLFLGFILVVGSSFAWEWQAGLKTDRPLPQESSRDFYSLLQGVSDKTSRIYEDGQKGYLPAVSSQSGTTKRDGISLGKTGTPGTMTLLGAQLAAFCNSHAYLFVLIWFLLIIAQSLKTIVHVACLHRLRYRGILAPPACWAIRIRELADRLQIKGRVELFESEIAKVPMMAGFLKPIILIPAGMLMQLPADQVEAVLLHELAHVRRKDYLVNLLQYFAEILFFFNPGVLWISSLIREEREHCCDDIAIGETQNKKQFIRALLSFQEYQLSGTNYALTFPGPQKRPLLQRVNRILHNDNKALDIREKIFLLACLLVTCGITLAFSHAGSRSKEAIPMIIKEEMWKEPRFGMKENKLMAKGLNDWMKKENEDTLPGKRSSGKDEGGNGDGHEDTRSDERSEREDSLQEAKAEEAENLKLLAETQASNLSGVPVQGHRFSRDQDTLPGLYEKRLDELQEFEKRLQEQRAQLEIQQQKLNEEYALLRHTWVRGYLLDSSQIEKRVEVIRKNMKDMEPLKIIAEEDASREAEREAAKLNRMNGDLERQQEAYLIAPKPAKRAKAITRGSAVSPVVSPIIIDLLHEKIITDTIVLSISLDADAMIVNGVRLPEKLHHRFQEKYLKKPDDRVRFNRNASDIKKFNFTNDGH